MHANTDRDSGKLKQRLDEHLLGVALHSRKLAGTLPRLERQLPRLARHKGFTRRVEQPRFRWQDKAYDCAMACREQAMEHGFFGLNLASTGCGKTLANGRILYALADPQRGARFSIALGLRSLTLQTGQAYRERLGLGDDDLAILVGGSAARELFESSRSAWSAAVASQPRSCWRKTAMYTSPARSRTALYASGSAGTARETAYSRRPSWPAPSTT